MTEPIDFACLMPTRLGPLGLVWTEVGLRRLLLPELDSAALDRKLTRVAPMAVRCGAGDVPADAREALGEYATGEPVDLTALPLDLSGVDEFRLAIYAAARRIGHGEITTYGALAAMAGFPGMARETGQAMGSNPVPIVIPCHRVVAAGGKLGGFSAPGGSATKARMLAMEKARFEADPRQAAFSF